MPSNLEMRVLRLEGLVQRHSQQRFAEQGGGGGGGGGAPGIFLATPAGSIAAGGTSSEAITQSWDGASAGTHTVRNTYSSATVAGRGLKLGKNPDGSYTIVGQDC
jgi:hypothetical protein